MSDRQLLEEAAPVKLHPLDLRRVRADMPPDQYKVGDEFAPFHPSASHVPPDYRDGWNRCWLTAQIAFGAAVPALDRKEA